MDTDTIFGHFLAKPHAEPTDLFQFSTLSQKQKPSLVFTYITVLLLFNLKVTIVSLNLLKDGSLEINVIFS